MKKIAIFASGSGSNTKNIVEYLKDQKNINVSLIVSNKSDAGVLKIAKKHSIPTLVLDKETFFSGNDHVKELRKTGIEFIVLAGFLWKVPPALIKAFPGKIINIHPALLPKYGGKGMYGLHVHQAVIDNKEAESGITIHYVDEQYDHGNILFQATCAVLSNDTAESLAKRVLELEHKHYPAVIEQLVEGSSA